MVATKSQAIEKIRALRRPLPNGTPVICKAWVKGRIDGMTKDGKYIVVLDEPVEFPTLGVSVQVVAFEQNRVERIK